MSDAPPPYPGPQSYPQGAPPPPPNPAYPPPNQPYPPPAAGYPPAGAPYGDPSKGGYPPQPMYPAGPPQQPYTQQPYGQQPYGQQPYGHQQHSTVVVTQPTTMVVQQFREAPVHTNCPHCRAEVVTGIHYESGTLAWVVCCVLWWIGCGLGCCLIPFCVDGCKDVIHTCPNCQQQIARFSRM